MTCRRRYFSASACGSSRVLMMERDEVVAPEISWQMCWARCEQAVVEAPRGLQHLARAGEDLPGHEERDQALGEPLERHVAADRGSSRGSRRSSPRSRCCS